LNFDLSVKAKHCWAYLRNLLFSVQYKADKKQNMICSAFPVAFINGAKIQISLHPRILTTIDIALNKSFGI
jgi:hypothetical protein